jgi:hypothetical protein
MTVNCTCTKPEANQINQPDVGRLYAGREDFPSALAEYKTMLRELPVSRRDRALFLIGLLKSDPQNPDRDINGALASFQELTGAYPSSARYDEARILSSLLERIIRLEQESTAAAEHIMALKEVCEERTDCCTTQKQRTVLLRRKVAQLKSQIERLKMIDLGIEEKKREQQRSQHEDRSGND